MSRVDFRVAAFLWAANLILLSHFSRYDIQNVKSLNWDIVLMLTPVGLLQNFWFQQSSYLRPYYDLTASAFSGEVLVLVATQTALSLFLLWRWRR